MKTAIRTTGWSIVFFFYMAAILSGCEQPQLKEGVISVKNVDCVKWRDQQRCTVTVLTRDTTRLYNAKHVQVLLPGEQYVPAE